MIVMKIGMLKAYYIYIYTYIYIYIQYTVYVIMKILGQKTLGTIG